MCWKADKKTVLQHLLKTKGKVCAHVRENGKKKKKKKAYSVKEIFCRCGSSANELDVWLLLLLSFILSVSRGELMEMCRGSGTTGVWEVAYNERLPAEC